MIELFGGQGEGVLDIKVLKIKVLVNLDGIWYR